MPKSGLGKKQAPLSEHQVRADRGVCHELHPVTETWYQYGEEGWTDLKSYAEHEQDKAEVLDKINYLEIAGEAEMSHKDTDEQYERHSKWNAKDPDSSKKHSNRYDQGVQKHDVCYGVRIEKQIV